MKMDKEILAFANIEIEKTNYHYKSPILGGDLNIDKVLVSNEISLGEKSCKYFTGCLYNGSKGKSLHIMLLKTSTYVKHFDGQTKWMYSLIKDDRLLGKYNTMWDKVSADI